MIRESVMNSRDFLTESYLIDKQELRETLFDRLIFPTACVGRGPSVRGG